MLVICLITVVSAEKDIYCDPGYFVVKNNTYYYCQDCHAIGGDTAFPFQRCQQVGGNN